MAKPSLPKSNSKNKNCSVPECANKHYNRDLCSKHYSRLGRHGSVYYERLSNPKSYKQVTRDGKQIREHRLIMEQHIGRSLSSSEIVHHKNSNKLDNRIENLEITNRSDHMLAHMQAGEIPSFIKQFDIKPEPLLVLLQKHSCKEIAEIFGCSTANIYGLIKKYQLRGRMG